MSDFFLDLMGIPRRKEERQADNASNKRKGIKLPKGAVVPSISPAPHAVRCECPECKPYRAERLPADFVLICCKKHNDFYLFSYASGISQLAMLGYADEHKKCKPFVYGLTRKHAEEKFARLLEAKKHG